MVEHEQPEQAALRWVDRHGAEMVQDLVELIRIESVEGPASPGRPFGEGVAQALEYVEQLARELGLETLNVDNHAVHAHLGPASPLVGVLTHVDVVPAGGGWSVPPFEGVVRDGRVYGRGAIDDKGPTVASLFALGALAAAGVDPARGVRLIVGGDEETGFECVRRYFQRQPHPDLAFSPDAVFPLVFAEKGILNLTLCGSPPPGPVRRIVGGDRANVVPDHAVAQLEGLDGETCERLVSELAQWAGQHRARLEATRVPGAGALRIESHGVATHGSTPENGVNAVAQLLSALAAVDAAGKSLDPSGMLGFLARAASDVHGGALDIARSDEVSGLLTSNLGVFRWDDGRVEGTFNIRYPVSLPSAAELVETVRALGAPHGLLVTKAADDPPHHVPAEGFLVRTLLDVYRSETGDTTPPLAIGGGTYARTIPGAVAFGPVFPFQRIVPHEKDESIEIEHLMSLARIYTRALFALSVSGNP